jgi:protein TonB
MNTKFILPGSFALTFHAFLLFGLTGKIPPVVGGPETKPPGPDIAIPIDADVPVSEPININDGPKSGGSGPVVPHLIEIPVLNPPIGSIPIATLPRIKGTSSTTSIPADWQNSQVSGRDPSLDTVGLGELDRPPRARAQPAPIYPADLSKSGVEGTVVVEFLVDKEGNVYSPVVLRASHPGFIDSALCAIRRWKFEPGQSGGRRVRFRMSVPLVFNLVGR